MINLTLSILSLICMFCNQQAFKAYSIKGYGQGSTYSITYYTQNRVLKKEQVDSILNVIDNSMSIYRTGSLINKFNSSSRGLKLDNHFKAVISKALEIYKESDGSFDVTVEPLMRAWNFGRVSVKSLPDAKLIASIKEHVGSNKLRLSGDSLIKEDPELKIDLNGIAQGYTVDVLSEFLEKNGIDNYLVELGGELRVKGVKRPSGEAFNIGIETPSSDNYETGKLNNIIEVRQGAVTTSGNYRNFYKSGNKKISHLINPDTGYPIENEIISATVYAREALTADGYDNVFMAMDIKKGFRFLEKHPELQVYIVYQKKDGSIADTASTGFKHLLKRKKEND